MLRASLTVGLLVVAASASAQTTADTTLEARAHFQAGLARAEQGDLTAALSEFEAAYAVRPHFSVLYNIGQARSTLGRPVEAVAAFERYLADGGAQITPSRHQEVEALLAANRRRIGSLHVVADAGSDARVWLDGSELAQEDLAAPIPVAVGQHSVIYTTGRGSPESRRVSVASGAVTELRIAARPDSGEVAQLAVVCEVPGVDVEIAGVRRASTPVPTPLLIPSGPLTVHLSRPGYRDASREVIAAAGALATVRCDLHAEQPLDSSHSARLIVRTTPADAEVKIDGERFLGAPIPNGPHHLLIERDGFRPDDRVISLDAGKTRIVDAKLAPTPAARQRDQRAHSHRKTEGIVLGSIGAALVATGVGLYAWNSGRYDDWRAKPNGDLNGATSIQRTDDASFGFMLLGAGLAGWGSWLFFDPM